MFFIKIVFSDWRMRLFSNLVNFFVFGTILLEFSRSSALLFSSTNETTGESENDEKLETSQDFDNNSEKENTTIQLSVEMLKTMEPRQENQETEDLSSMNVCEEPSSTDQFLYLFIFVDECYAFSGSGPRWSEMTGWTFDESTAPSTTRVSHLNGRKRRLSEKDRNSKTTIFSCGNGKKLPPFAPIVHILNASWFLQASTVKTEEKERKTERMEEVDNKNGTIDNETAANLTARTTSSNKTSITEQEQNKSNPDEDWCMMVNFYAPSCPFSARLAPFYNALPRVFPKLLYIAAVDATESSRLNLIYGVAGTPTVMLFQNGKPVARFDDAEYALQRLISFITEHTDLKPLSNVDVENEDLQGPLPSIPIRGVDYYLVLAWIFVVACAMYYGSRTSTVQRIWEALCRNWREMEEAVAQRPVR